MQVENLSCNDIANTPSFGITSNDSVQPKTWGVEELKKAGGSPKPGTIQALPSIPTSVLAEAFFTPSSSDLLFSSASYGSTDSLVSPFTTQSPTSFQKLTSGNNNDNKINRSAKAGIGIGSIIAVLLMILILFLAWSLRSRQRQRQAIKESETAKEINGEKPLGSYEICGHCRPNELQGNPIAELLGTTSN